MLVSVFVARWPTRRRSMGERWDKFYCTLHELTHRMVLPVKGRSGIGGGIILFAHADVCKLLRFLLRVVGWGC